MIGPEPYRSTAVPLERAAARLVERHRLPWFVVPSIEIFVLTSEKSWLEGQEFALSLLDLGDCAPTVHGGFTLSLSGLDEFITKGDWEKLWESQVQPRQDLLWSSRGLRPQGRMTPDIERLRGAIPLYRLVTLEGLSAEQALGTLEEREENGNTWGQMDYSKANGLVRELRLLLLPDD